MSYNLTHGPIPTTTTHMHHSYSHDPNPNDKALDSAVRQLFELYLPDKVENSNQQPPEPQRHSSSTTANNAHYEVFNGANSHYLRPRDPLLTRGGGGGGGGGGGSGFGRSMVSMGPTGRPINTYRPATTASWTDGDRETEYVQTAPMVQVRKQDNTNRMNPGVRPNMQTFNPVGMDPQSFRPLLPQNSMIHRQASPPPPFPPVSHHRLSISTSTDYPHTPHALQIEYKNLPPMEDEPDFQFDANQVTRGQETPLVRRTRPDVNPLSPIRPQKLPWSAPMMNPARPQLYPERLSPSNSTIGPDSRQFASMAGDQNSMPQPDSTTRRRRNPSHRVRFYEVVTVISPEQAPISGNNHRGGSGGRQGQTIAPVATEPFASSRTRDLLEVGMGVDLRHEEYEEAEEAEEEEEEEEEEEDTPERGGADEEEDGPEGGVSFHDSEDIDGVLKYKEQHGIPTRTSSDGPRDEWAAEKTAGDDKPGGKFGRFKNFGKRLFL